MQSIHAMTCCRPKSASPIHSTPAQPQAAACHRQKRTSSKCSASLSSLAADAAALARARLASLEAARRPAAPVAPATAPAPPAAAEPSLRARFLPVMAAAVFR